MSILTDLYQTLFGKNHIQDGNVIDMAEHGRQGGLSTKQGFKFTKDVTQNLLTHVNASLTYIGYASPGISPSLPYWQIMRINASDSIQHADGDDNFDNVWELKETYTYS